MVVILINNMRNNIGEYRFNVPFYNRMFSSIAILILCFIATVMQYHHHDDDKICFLWTENHVSNHCHNEESKESHPFNSDSDHCGLHTAQFIENLNDDYVVLQLVVALSIIRSEPLLSDFTQVNLFYSTEVLRGPDNIDYRVKNIDFSKSIVRRGPPCA